MTQAVIETVNLDAQINALLIDAERSLKPVVDEDFLERNDYLRKKISDPQILEVFRLCLMRPGGNHWSPVWQVLLLLFQAAFSESYASCKDRFTKVGNYLIHRLPPRSKPVIYSFGIGNDISFDTAAADEFGVPIYMYDPTPGVALLMKEHESDERLVFRSEGIYSREAEFKFYTSDKRLNSSLYPIYGKADHEIVKCRTLASFMEENDHYFIDILKMDVEGVADDVLAQVMDETDIRPKQIVTEFEIKGIENPLTYLPKILAVAQKLKNNGYLIFNQQLTRKTTIELVIVHQSLYDELEFAQVHG
jgi:FkbM family methyltransferase